MQRRDMKIQESINIQQKLSQALISFQSFQETLDVFISQVISGIEKDYSMKIRETPDPSEKEKLFISKNQIIEAINAISLPQISKIIGYINGQEGNIDFMKLISRFIKEPVEQIITELIEKIKKIEEIDANFQLILANLSNDGDKEKAIKNANLVDLIKNESVYLENIFVQIENQLKTISDQVESYNKKLELIATVYEEKSFQLLRLTRAEGRDDIVDKALKNDILEIEKLLGLEMEELAYLKKTIDQELADLNDQASRLRFKFNQTKAIKDAFDTLLNWSNKFKKQEVPLIKFSEISVPKNLIDPKGSNVDFIIEKIRNHQTEKQPIKSSDSKEEVKPEIDNDIVKDDFKFPPIAIAIAVLETYGYKNGRKIETIIKAAKICGLINENQVDLFKEAIIQAVDPKNVPKQLEMQKGTSPNKKAIFNIYKPTEYGQRMTFSLMKRMITPEIKEKIISLKHETNEKVRKDIKIKAEKKKKKSAKEEK